MKESERRAGWEVEEEEVGSHRMSSSISFRVTGSIRSYNSIGRR